MTQKLRTPRTENAAILYSTKHSWSFTIKWQKMGTFKNHLKENVSLHLLQPFRRMLQLFFCCCCCEAPEMSCGTKHLHGGELMIQGHLFDFSLRAGVMQSRESFA